MGKQVECLNVIDFSEYPGPRYKDQGPDSGELFYVNKLNPSFSECYKEGKLLKVILDGTAGFASSFLDEAFGQLTFDFGESLVKEILLIESFDEPEWSRMIMDETIPQWEKRREKGEVPKATMSYKVDSLNQDGTLFKRKSNESV